MSALLTSWLLAAPRPLLSQRIRQVRFLRIIINAVVISLLTVLILKFGQWALVDAVWSASTRNQCLELAPSGACWAGVRHWFSTLIFGFVPPGAYGRVIAAIGYTTVAAVLLLCASELKVRACAALALFLGPCAMAHILYGDGGAIVRLLASAGYVTLSAGLLWQLKTMLLGGGYEPNSFRVAFALAGATIMTAALLPTFSTVPTRQWGGASLTYLIWVFGVAFSGPAGFLLALGRRSKSVLRIPCTGLIEIMRALPLITVLITTAIILPKIFPSLSSVDLLIRASIALTVAYAATFAEIVRAGFNAIPFGQYDAAYSLGLGYWRTMGFVVVPQIVRTMMPALIATVANLLKDTALVSVVGLFDLMNVARAVGRETAWVGMIWEPLVFAALVYLIACTLLTTWAGRANRINLM